MILLQNWWFTTLLGIEDPIQPPLKNDIEADVLIVGAGAAGLSAAYALMNRGLKVVILEKNIFGGSSSGKSAGFLTPDSELELSQLIRRFGKKGAADMWGVATKGVEMMAKRIINHSMFCDFQVQDCLYLGIGESGWKAVKEEVDARKLLGFKQTLYDKNEVRKIIGSDGYSGAVRYPGTFGVDALLYCQGMKKILLQNGITIYEASEVTELNDHTAKTHLGSVTARKIIFCADKLKPTISHYAKNIYHAQTFLSISEPLSNEMVKEIFPADRFQCWDSTLVYTYFRLTGDNRILLGGGNILTTFSKYDVDSSVIINRVIKKFKEKFPQLKNLEFIQYWPGRIDTTRDLLPTIVSETKNSWLHFVLGCVGLPWATFCGDFVARHTIGDDSLHDDYLYDYFHPERNFFIPLWLEGILGKRILFSLNNGWAKYYEKDTVKVHPPLKGGAQ